MSYITRHNIKGLIVPPCLWSQYAILTRCSYKIITTIKAIETRFLSMRAGTSSGSDSRGKLARIGYTIQGFTIISKCQRNERSSEFEFSMERTSRGDKTCR